MPTTLLDLLDEAVGRYGDRTALGLRHDDGIGSSWTYRELDRRSRIAAWRLRALGLEPGDRLLTWSPSTPELPGGVLRGHAGAADHRAAGPADVVRCGRRHRQAHRARATSSWVRDATRRIRAKPGSAVPDHVRRGPRGRPGRDLPARLGGAGRGLAGPGRGRGLRARLHVGHDRNAEGRDARPRQRAGLDRDVPPDRPADGASARLAPATLAPARAGGRAVLRPVGRRRHPLRPKPQPSRDLRCAARPAGDLDGRRPAGPRPVLERHRTRGRRSAAARAASNASGRSPGTCRWACAAGCSRASTRSSVASSACSCRPARSCRRRSSRGGRTSASRSSRDTARPRRAPASCTTLEDHGLGTVGRPPAGIEMRLADDGEIQFRGPTLFKGYWQDPAATAAAYTEDGWYRTGDMGRLDAAGRLILSGRTRDMIVMPNGFNVYPEDIENALRVAGLRDTVVVETRPGRIEAIVLTAAASPVAPSPLDRPEPRPIRRGLRAPIDARRQGGQRAAGPNQRIHGWRLWPDEDFPRTHTLKIKRDPVALGDRRYPAADPHTGADHRRPGSARRLSLRSGTRRRAFRARAGCPVPGGSSAAPGNHRTARPWIPPGAGHGTVPSGVWTRPGPLAR